MLPSQKGKEKDNSQAEKAHFYQVYLFHWGFRLKKKKNAIIL